MQQPLVQPSQEAHRLHRSSLWLRVLLPRCLRSRKRTKRWMAMLLRRTSRQQVQCPNRFGAAMVCRFLQLFSSTPCCKHSSRWPTLRRSVCCAGWTSRVTAAAAGLCCRATSSTRWTVQQPVSAGLAVSAVSLLCPSAVTAGVLHQCFCDIGNCCCIARQSVSWCVSAAGRQVCTLPEPSCDAYRS